MTDTSTEKSNVIIFEAFKNAKKWDDEYPQFLGKAEQCFGAKTDPESMVKRLYYALRYLDGVANSQQIFRMLGLDTMLETPEQRKGKEYCIRWLEDILKKIKG